MPAAVLGGCGWLQWFGFRLPTKRGECPACAQQVEDAEDPQLPNALGERQGDQTNYIAYGPMVKGAEKFIKPDMLPHMPTAAQNTQNYFLMDATFWADNRESLTARMATWMAK